MKIDIHFQSNEWEPRYFHLPFPPPPLIPFRMDKQTRQVIWVNNLLGHEAKNMRASSCPYICSLDLAGKGRLLRFSLCVVPHAG